MKHNINVKVFMRRMIAALRRITPKSVLTAAAATVIFASCSTTKSLREGEQLFIGLEK